MIEVLPEIQDSLVVGFPVDQGKRCRHRPGFPDHSGFRRHLASRVSQSRSPLPENSAFRFFSDLPHSQSVASRRNLTPDVISRRHGLDSHNRRVRRKTWVAFLLAKYWSCDVPSTLQNRAVLHREGCLARTLSPLPNTELGTDHRRVRPWTPAKMV